MTGLRPHLYSVETFDAFNDLIDAAERINETIDGRIPYPDHHVRHLARIAGRCMEIEENYNIVHIAATSLPTGGDTGPHPDPNDAGNPPASSPSATPAACSDLPAAGVSQGCYCCAYVPLDGDQLHGCEICDHSFCELCGHAPTHDPDPDIDMGDNPDQCGECAWGGCREVPHCRELVQVELAEAAS